MIFALGLTKKRVEDRVKAAKGGLLFIDEAYSLGSGPFGEEAMTKLLQMMTEEAYAGKMVILGDYLSPPIQETPIIFDK